MAIQRSLVDAVEVTESQIHIIRLKNIFDASTASEFEKVVSYLLAKSFFKIVVDLSHVEFISSAGWGGFTGELRRVRESDGDIKLCGMNKELFDVFLLLELDSFIRAYDTDEEAIMAFMPSSPAFQPAPGIGATATNAGPASVETQVIPAVAETQFEPAAGVIAPRRERQEEYRWPDVASKQETFAAENNTIAAETPALAHDGRNGFSHQQNFGNEDDTNEIDADSPIAASGPEMYELLLTSGQPALDPAIARQTLPSRRASRPPSPQAAPHPLDEHGVAEPALEHEKHGDFVDDVGEHPAADSNVERFNHVDFGDNDDQESSESVAERYEDVEFGDDRDEREAEKRFAKQETQVLGTAPEPSLYDYAPLTDDTQRLKTEEFADLTSNETLHFSGHEPIIEESAHEYAEFNEADADEHETDFTRSPAEPDADSSGPRSLAWQDNEAFAELSLDLESHLQKPQRVFEAHDGDAELYSRQAARENEPFPAPGGSGTEEFAAPTYSFRNELDDSAGADDGENYDREFPAPETETAPDFSAPAFGDSGNNNNLVAPSFSTDFAHVLPDAFAFANNSTPEQDDEFETQDICDPWILEEIDTLPEEYEMDEVTAEDDTPIAAPEFISRDFDAELEPLTLAPANGNASSATRPETESVDTHAAPNLPTVGDETLAEPMPREARTDATDEEMAASPGRQTMSGDDEAYRTPRLTATRSSIVKRKPSFEPVNLESLPKIPMSDNIAEMVCGIIAAYPDFGPNMICRFLEERVEPPVSLSRSTIYRYLCEVGLNTREKRYQYAGQEINFKDAGVLDMAQEAELRD